jgi:hypothetical protein
VETSPSVAHQVALIILNEEKKLTKERQKETPAKNDIV